MGSRRRTCVGSDSGDILEVGKMKRTILVCLMFVVAMTASATTKYASPQTVLWDDTETTLGTISYEVYVIHKVDDKGNQADYVFVAEVSAMIQLVDIEPLGLQGDYIVAVRTVQVYEGETLLSGYAYSDVLADVDTETFYVRFIRTGKPKKIRIQ